MVKLPMRADGEIGENFLLAKISVYTVVNYYYYYYLLAYIKHYFL